jgi:hypothetical protein
MMKQEGAELRIAQTSDEAPPGQSFKTSPTSQPKPTYEVYLPSPIMASTTVLRRFALAARPARNFHSSSRAFIKVGDKIPALDVLVEDSPGNKVNLSKLQDLID